MMLSGDNILGGASDILLPLSRGAAILLIMIYLLYFWFFHGMSRVPVLTPVQSAALLGGFLASAPLSSRARDSFPVMLLQATRERFEKQQRSINPLISLGLVSISVPMLAMCSLNTIYSIKAPKKYLKMSKSFSGLVLIPVLIGALEHVTAPIHPRRHDVEWVVEAIIVSSIRMSLLVLPASIFMAWCLNIGSMTLFFDGF